jgi:ubiquinol-cytochrome c reductase iron-sulfur subunit
MDREAIVKPGPPPPVALVAAAVAGVAAVSALIAFIVAGPSRGAVATMAVAAVAGGLALAAWGRAEPHEEEARQQKGPSIERRRFLMGLAASLGALTAGALATTAAFRTGSATERLRSTPFTGGVRIVDPDGAPLHAASIDIGSLVTAFPEGHTGAADAQTLVVGVEPERISTDHVIADGVAIVAYSKLCTHMACPVGLYQERQGTVVCPCHQAVFDLLDDGRVLQGPAGRPLPRLPIDIGPDGTLMATGDFTDSVGTGFWRRP